METYIIPGAVGFCSALLLSIVSHFLLLGRLRMEVRTSFSSNVQEKILSSYQKLWENLKPLSRFIPDSAIYEVTNEDYFLNVERTQIFVAGLTEYFYSENGLLISKRVRDGLFSLRSFLNEITENKTGRISISRSKGKDLEFLKRNLIVSIREEANMRHPQTNRKLYKF